MTLSIIAYTGSPLAWFFSEAAKVVIKSRKIQRRKRLEGPLNNQGYAITKRVRLGLYNRTVVVHKVSFEPVTSSSLSIPSSHLGPVMRDANNTLLQDQDQFIHHHKLVKRIKQASQQQLPQDVSFAGSATHGQNSSSFELTLVKYQPSKLQHRYNENVDSNDMRHHTNESPSLLLDNVGEPALETKQQRDLAAIERMFGDHTKLKNVQIPELEAISQILLGKPIDTVTDIGSLGPARTALLIGEPDTNMAMVENFSQPDFVQFSGPHSLDADLFRLISELSYSHENCSTAEGQDRDFQQCADETVSESTQIGNIQHRLYFEPVATQKHNSCQLNSAEHTVKTNHVTSTNGERGSTTNRVATLVGSARQVIKPSSAMSATDILTDRQTEANDVAISPMQQVGHAFATSLTPSEQVVVNENNGLCPPLEPPQLRHVATTPTRILSCIISECVSASFKAKIAMNIEALFTSLRSIANKKLQVVQFRENLVALHCALCCSELLVSGGELAVSCYLQLVLDTEQYRTTLQTSLNRKGYNYFLELQSLLPAPKLLTDVPQEVDCETLKGKQTTTQESVGELPIIGIINQAHMCNSTSVFKLVRQLGHLNVELFEREMDMETFIIGLRTACVVLCSEMLRSENDVEGWLTRLWEWVVVKGQRAYTRVWILLFRPRFTNAVELNEKYPALVSRLVALAIGLGENIQMIVRQAVGYSDGALQLRAIFDTSLQLEANERNIPTSVAYESSWLRDKEATIQETALTILPNFNQSSVACLLAVLQRSLSSIARGADATNVIASLKPWFSVDQVSCFKDLLFAETSS